MTRRIIMVFILLVTLGGCSRKDKCNDSCLNGSCIGDSCACTTGYTGKWCQTYVGGAASSSSGSSSTGSSSGNGGPSSSSTSASGNGGPSWDLVIWKDFDGPPVKVSFGPTIYWGKQITKYYTSLPDCFAEGCARITPAYIGPPIHYNATDGTHNWEGDVSHTGPCTMVKLEKP